MLPAPELAVRGFADVAHAQADPQALHAVDERGRRGAGGARNGRGEEEVSVDRLALPGRGQVSPHARRLLRILPCTPRAEGPARGDVGACEGLPGPRRLALHPGCGDLRRIHAGAEKPQLDARSARSELGDGAQGRHAASSDARAEQEHPFLRDAVWPLRHCFVRGRGPLGGASACELQGRHVLGVEHMHTAPVRSSVRLREGRRHARDRAMPSFDGQCAQLHGHVGREAHQRGRPDGTVRAQGRWGDEAQVLGYSPVRDAKLPRFRRASALRIHVPAAWKA